MGVGRWGNANKIKLSTSCSSASKGLAEIDVVEKVVKIGASFIRLLERFDAYAREDVGAHAQSYPNV